MAMASFELPNLGWAYFNGDQVRFVSKAQTVDKQPTTWASFDNDHRVLVFGEPVEVAEKLCSD